MSLPRYPEYKDSGVRWLKEVPSHWTICRYKTVFRERAERSDDGSENLLSVSAYTGVSRRSEIIDDGDHLSRAESLEGYKVCYPGDLVMNIMLAWNRGLGFASEHGIVSPAYSVFEVVADADARFLDYLVRSDSSIWYYKAYSAGVIDSRLRLYPDTFGSLYCVLPGAEEQRAIAAFLDRETAKIDALIAEQEKLLSLLAEKRQATISHSVTKGLNPSAPMKDSGIPWLGEVPAHWEIMALGRVTINKCDGPFGSGLKSDHYVDEGARVIRLQNIRGGRFDGRDAAFIELGYFGSEMPRHEVREGDLLVAGLGDDNNVVGRACVAPKGIYPALVKADCFRFRLDTDRALPEFAAWALTVGATFDAGVLSSGSTRSRIPLSVMAARRISLPPIGEQSEISRHIETIQSDMNRLAVLVAQAIELLRERRSALISGAVTGKIDVRGVA